MQNSSITDTVNPTGINDRRLSDYNPEAKKRIQFENFSMFSTERFSNVYLPGIFEKFTSDLIRFSLRPGMTFVDIGAHHGYYSLLASQQVGPSGTVIACEPVAENIELMEQSIRQNNFTNITIYNVAISDEKGQKEFCIAEESDACGFNEHPNSPTLGKRLVESYTLDNLIGERSVDILKTDTEGHEPQVFRGMSETLSRNPKIWLFIEFNPKCLIKSGHNPDTFLEEIDRIGFDIYFIQDQERQLFRYSKANPLVYQRIMLKGSHINLLCIKKERSVFVNLLSHSAGKTGGERLLSDTVDYFLEEQFLVHVTSPSDGPLVQLLKQRPVSIEITPLPFWTREHTTEQQHVFQKLVMSVPALISGIMLRNPHILFTNTSVIPQGAFAAGLLGLPHIWRITEFGLPEFGIEYLIEEHIRKQFIVAGSEKIIFVSNALRKTYTPYPGKDQDVTMYSAVRDLMNKTSIDPFEKKPLLKIICPSTICQGKRQEDIITAVHLLDQKGIQSVLVGLIGDVTSEEYGKKLNELIRRYQLESRVEILPFADNLWDKYRDAEMVVSTSVNEGYGRIVVEGMAHGKFVIGTDSGATRELICHGETGLLYQPGDPEDLAKKILQYINESVDIRQIRQNAFDFVYRNCHPEQYKKQITQIIREIIFNGHKILKNYTLCFDVFYISYLEMLFNEYKNLAEELKVLKDKEYEISSLRSSLSWKMTSPVRYLHSWIYNLLKRSR